MSPADALEAGEIPGYPGEMEEMWIPTGNVRGESRRAFVDPQRTVKRRDGSTYHLAPKETDDE